MKNETRVARYRVSLNPRELWPGLSEGSFFAVTEAIAEVTAGMLGSPTAPLALRMPDGLPHGMQGIVAFASGMGPLLGYWIETGQVETDPETRDILSTHLEHGRLRAERAQELLTRLLRELEAVGAEAVLLKGSHLASSYYPDPGTRPMADIDLLVNEGSVPLACEVLGGMGLTPAFTAYHATTWVSGQDVVSLEYDHVDNPLMIDLHTSLDRKVRSTSARFELSFDSDTEPWDGVDAPARVLRTPLLIWYLAVHIAAHFRSFQLVRLVDLALVSRAHRSAEPWQELLRRVDLVGEHRLVYPGLLLTSRLAPDSIPFEVLEHLGGHTPARIHKVVDEMSPARTQRFFRTSMKETLMWADSPWSRVRYLASKLRPRRRRGARGADDGTVPIRHQLLRLLQGTIRWRF